MTTGLGLGNLEVIRYIVF